MKFVAEVWVFPLKTVEPNLFIGYDVNVIFCHCFAVCRAEQVEQAKALAKWLDVAKA